MAHDLSHIVHHNAMDGLWTAGTAISGSPYCAPSSLNFSASLDWLATSHCRDCAQKQTSNHTTRAAWRFLDGAGSCYWGPNPIPVGELVKELDEQLQEERMFLQDEERWINAWWTVMIDGGFVSALYNAMGPNGEFYPNFQEGREVPATSVSGADVTLNVSGVDVRSFYGDSPLQVRDFVHIRGWNCAYGMIAQIKAISGIAEGLAPAKPSSIVVTLDKNLSPGIGVTNDPGQSWSLSLWIGRERAFPETWTHIEYPSYFFGGFRRGLYVPGDTGWSTGTFRLKDFDGADCAVLAPATNAEGYKTIAVRRQETDFSWTDVDVAGLAGPARRTALFVASTPYRSRFSSTTLTIDAVFRADVTGLALGDFSVTPGATLSNLTTVTSAYHFRLTLTVTTPGADVQEFTVSVAENAGTEWAGHGTHAASVTVTYDGVTPTVTLSSTESTATTLKAIPVLIQTLDGDSNPTRVIGVGESDVSTVTNANLEGFGGNSSVHVFELVPTAGAVAAQIAASGFTSESGENNAQSNLLEFTWTSAGTEPDPIIYTTGLSERSSGVISCVVFFHNEGVTGFSSANLTTANCTVGNWVAVSAVQYTFDLTPDLEDGETEGEVLCQVDADEVYDVTTGNTDLNLASNTLCVSWFEAGPETELTSAVPTFYAGAIASFELKFSRPVSGNIASAISCSAGGPVNIKGTDTGFSFDVPCEVAGAYWCEVPAAGMTARDGKTNQASAKVEWTVVADSATPMATTSRLFVHHDLGDVDHESAYSTLYLSGTIDGKTGYENLMTGAVAIEVSYWPEIEPDDYENRPRAVGSRRCRYCQPDLGGVWGYDGPDGRGYRWYCAAKNFADTPLGLSEFGAQCYLVNVCQHFAPVPITSFLNPAGVLKILEEMWTGSPGGLRQIRPGSSSHRNLAWYRATRPSITSHLTHNDLLAYTMQYTPWYWPRGSSAYGRWHDEAFKQGVAHEHEESGDETWDDPNTDTPPDGILPVKIAGWKTKHDPIENHELIERDDPYGELARWPTPNCWGTFREGMATLAGDPGPSRYQRLNQGQTIENETILIPRIEATTGLQTREHGLVEYGWWNAGLVRCAEGSAVYGALIRVLPHPHLTDPGTAIAAGTIHSITVSEYTLEDVTEYVIECEPSLHHGQWYTVLPGLGTVINSEAFYTGGNVVGAPEWARNRNPAEESALVNACGPGKGAGRGNHMVFFDGASVAKTYDIGETANNETPLFSIMEARFCASSDRFAWDDAGAYSADPDDDWYDEHVAACYFRPHEEKAWGNKYDLLYVADPDGVIADMITAGTVAAGKTFAVYNWYATFSPLSAARSLYWTTYQTSAWTQLTGGGTDFDEIDSSIGLIAVKKAAAATIYAAGAHCFRVVAPDGRLSQASMGYVTALNETQQALQALDEVLSPVRVGGTESTMKVVRHQMLSRFTDTAARYNDGDYEDDDGARDACSGYISGRGRKTNPCSLWGADPYSFVEVTTTTDAFNDPKFGASGLPVKTPLSEGFSAGGWTPMQAVGSWAVSDVYYWYFWGPEAYASKGDEEDPFDYDSDDSMRNSTAAEITAAAIGNCSEHAYVIDVYWDQAMLTQFGLGGAGGWSIASDAYRWLSINQTIRKIWIEFPERVADGVTIESAKAMILVTLSHYKTWDYRLYFSEMPGGPIKHWGKDPEWHCDDPDTQDWETLSEYRTANHIGSGFWTPVIGHDPYIEGLELPGTGKPIGHVDNYGPSGTINESIDPVSPQVKLALYGKNPDGTFDHLGYSGSFTAVYSGTQADEVDLTSFVTNYYANRGQYKSFAAAVVHPSLVNQSEAMPAGTFTAVTEWPGTTGAPGKHVFPSRVELPCIEIKQPTIAFQSGIGIRFTVDSGTVQCGGGVVGNLPSFV